jgi:REP element-mobilizing transposase RayT
MKLQVNPYRYRRKLPHLQLSSTFFVTFSTYKERILSPQARTLAFRSCLYEHDRRIHLYAGVVMPDHVHLLFSILFRQATEPLLYRIVGDIKSASVHNINKALRRSGRVWMNESFDRMPRAGEFERYYEYIIMNPVRAGLVTNPDDYEWLWYL